MKLIPDSQETSKLKKKLKKTQSEFVAVEVENDIEVNILSNTEVHPGKPVKKKRKHSIVDQNVHSDDRSNSQGLPSLDDVNVGLKKPHKRRKVESSADRGGIDNHHTAVDPVHNLLDNMSRVLQESHSKKKVPYKTTVNHFDWQKVCFDNHGPDECKTMWLDICQQVRKFRTLAELVDEAKSKTLKDPHKPKPPIPPLFLFFKKKRSSVARKHPNLQGTELTKLLTKKYENLSELKKQKYVDAYQKAKMLYVLEMAKYRAEHSRPVNPMSACQYFVYKKCSKKGTNELTKEQQTKLKIKYRKRWSELEPEKKVKFMKEALTASEEFKKKLESDPTCKDKFVPDIKLLKCEQMLMKNPEQASSSSRSSSRQTSFSLFYEKFAKRCHESKTSCNMKMAGEAWRNLSPKKRAHYTKKALEARSLYQQQNPIKVDSKKPIKGAPGEIRTPYALFRHETLPALSYLIGRSAQLAECKKQWDELSTSSKNLWKQKLATAKLACFQELEQSSTEEQLHHNEVTLVDKTNVEEKKHASRTHVSKHDKAKKSKVQDIEGKE